MASINKFLAGQFQNDEEEEVGIGGFVTAARLRERMARTRQVPTTYLEDGTAVSDHIIRDPLTISIEGEVSDVFVRPNPILERIREAQAQVGAVALYAPARTQSQLSRVSGLVGDVSGLINQVDQALATAQNFGDYIGVTEGDGAKTNIEKFIDYMEGLHASDSLIKIDAPFRTYKNMAITLFNWERDNTTNSVSFSIEAQEFRFVETIFVEVSAAPNPAPGTNGQTQAEADKGAQEGEDVPQSFLDAQLERFGV